MRVTSDRVAVGFHLAAPRSPEHLACVIEHLLEALVTLAEIEIKRVRPEIREVLSGSIEDRRPELDALGVAHDHDGRIFAGSSIS